ncbi:MAG: type II toxin-antitoxin system RelE/ParE family toxin [Prevotellaceae bacterium]|jgi:mRNA interferase RelE/StbE|nr:type II toxin-antitoxin system RelE/ParE family toxin [Prevotellaceae bacterium]
MTKYTVYLSKKAQLTLDRLSDHLVAPILFAIEKLSDNPRPAGCKKLKGQYGYRIRVGNYRIIYDIIDNKLIVEIIAIGNRKDIYR